jgi:methyl-accepting chemotaxis protein
MQWTIGKKLYTNVAALGIVIMGIVGGAVYIADALMTDLDEFVDKIGPNLRHAEELGALAESYRSANRYNVILAMQHNGAALEANRKKMEVLHGEFTKMAEALAQNSTTEEAKTLARQAVDEMNSFDAKGMEIARLAADFKTSEAADQIRVAAPLGDKVEATADKLAEIQQARLNVVNDESNRSQRNGNISFVFMGVVALLALGCVVYFVRDIVKTLSGMVGNLKSGSEQVTSAATQVAASAQTLSQGSTEQAASLEETSASMEEMASMTRKNAENSQQAAELITEVDRLVAGSNKALDDMTQSMASIHESSNKVSKIIKTIDEIAFQTNILALNAAVEAARAGEAGMGFAVVADEVRNLAQRSAQAAKDTASLIEESIAKSQEGHAKVDIVAQSMSAITDSVAKVKGLVTEVSDASRQQAQGIDQVAQAVAQMEKVTQSTAASAEESAAASEELNAQAETTMADVVRLEEIVVGSQSGVVRTPTRTSVSRVAGSAGKLLSLPIKANSKPRSSASAEDEIPLRETGTFGKF